MTACAQSWGTTEAGWIFCVLPKGHAGQCADYAGNPPNAPFFHDQPEAQAAIEAQRVKQAKEDAKKGRT